jgi:peptide deformylase
LDFINLREVFMTARGIRKIGDPVLREKSKYVEEIDEKVLSLVKDMVDTMEKEGGVGLAAPQIGVSRRVVVVNMGEEIRSFINPEIKILGKEKVASREGCLSVYSIVDFDVERFKKVEVRAKDLKGKDVTFVAEDLVARIFQHEIDHLNGILFFDHLDTKSRRELLSMVNEINMGM